MANRIPIYSLVCGMATRMFPLKVGLGRGMGQGIPNYKPGSRDGQAYP